MDFQRALVTSGLASLETAGDGRGTTTRASRKRQLDRASRLLILTTALSELSTVQQVADVVLEQGLGVVEATRGFLALVSGSRVTMIATRGYDDAMRSRVLEVDEGTPVPIVDAARTGRAVWLENVAEYRERYPWAYERFGAVSESQAHCAVPLTHGGEVIGALGVSFLAPTAFGADDRTFMLLLGHVAALALARARLYDQESEGRRHAELTASARADVLGIVAHDLRNPLNLVGMTAQFLLETELSDDRRRQLLETQRRAVKQMNRLVEDLLDAVRLVAGGLTLSVAGTSVSSLLKHIEELHQPIAEQRHIAFSVRAADQNVEAMIDEERIGQALGNLITNALKFTPEHGSVMVRATVDGADLRFSVTDTGPGIPADALTRIFDRFWQARGGDRRGVGLGLAIVKGIVDAHGGSISVNSAVGRGSEFHLLLPNCVLLETAQSTSAMSTTEEN